MTKYVFRWKDVDGRPMEVVTPPNRSAQEVWDWAIKALRPAKMTNDAAAERLVRQNGEVVRAEEKP